MSSPLAARSTSLATRACLVVEPTDIRFHSPDAERVRIEVTVHNEGNAPSAPTWMALQSAPLGAFLPWTPLVRLAVPSVPARGSVLVVTDVARPPTLRPDATGTLPPTLARTMRGASDDEERRRQVRQRALDDLLDMSPGRGASPSAASSTLRTSMLRAFVESRVRGQSLAPDVLARSPHWAGNINVFVSGRAVERHMAPALRLHRGRTNMAAFCIAATCEVSFRLEGSGSAWNPVLYALSRVEETSIVVDQWISLTVPASVLLTVDPPAEATRGEIHVHVCRRDTGETAVVEFSLDAEAAGPGCYTL